jgi:hypothetical protein
MNKSQNPGISSFCVHVKLTEGEAKDSRQVTVSFVFFGSFFVNAIMPLNTNMRPVQGCDCGYFTLFVV